MKINKNKVVTLAYQLKIDDANGELVEEVNSNQPFVHLFGVGSLLESFENNLSEKSIGDTFEFTLTSKEAYGDINENALVDLPLQIFEVNGKIDYQMLEIGNVIPMQNQDGQPLQGTVVSVGEENVKMDFNHPLAGKALYFTGNILDIREATAEELAHGHVHVNGGHQH